MYYLLAGLFFQAFSFKLFMKCGNIKTLQLNHCTIILNKAGLFQTVDSEIEFPALHFHSFRIAPPENLIHPVKEKLNLSLNTIPEISYRLPAYLTTFNSLVWNQ